jgi:Leucine-rich repeat (LRR) protein
MRSVLSLCFLLLLLTACSEDNSISDRDGDGAHDQLDLFPDDASKAFSLTGEISDVRGSVTLVLNDQRLIVNTGGTFRFDIPYGEAFKLQAESSLADELCLISSPEHDATTAIEAITISCIERTDINLALNSIVSDYLRLCIEEQDAIWVDEITELDCKVEIIDSADGIEEFVFLNKLALRLVEEISTSDSKIRSIDLSKNRRLEEIDIVVSDIDISGLDRLRKLHLSGYEGVEIDLFNHNSLTNLFIIAYDLERIEVNHLTNLEEFAVLSRKLETLEVSNLDKLRVLAVSASEMEDIDVTKNENLLSLGIIYSPISTLNISNNKKLNFLMLLDCMVVAMDVSNNINIMTLILSSNKLEMVPVGIRSIKNKLAEINLNYNPFTENAKAELELLKQEYENLTFDE